MEDFSTFIVTGKTDSYEASFKDKSMYLLNIAYYTIALIFAVHLGYQIVNYLMIDNPEGSILTQIGHALDKSKLMRELAYLALVPIISAFTFWYCLTDFDFNKVTISFSLIITIASCLLIYPADLLPLIIHAKIDIVFVSLFIFGLSYLIISNALTKSNIVRLRNFWRKHPLLITYTYVLMYASLQLLNYEQLALPEVVTNIAISVAVALILIYVRRFMGMGYAVFLHYVVTLSPLAVLFYFS